MHAAHAATGVWPEALLRSHSPVVEVLAATVRAHAKADVRAVWPATWTWLAFAMHVLAWCVAECAGVCVLCEHCIATPVL